MQQKFVKKGDCIIVEEEEEDQGEEEKQQDVEEEDEEDEEDGIVVSSLKSQLYYCCALPSLMHLTISLSECKPTCSINISCRHTRHCAARDCQERY